jgi:WD40 repeat protein
MHVARWLAVGAALWAGASAEAVGPPPARRDVYDDPLPRGAVARLGSMRLRHSMTTWTNLGKAGSAEMYVGRVALSPDGKKVVSLDDDLRVWDRASGALLARFEHRQHYHSALAFSPDGKHLLSGHETVLVWDLQTGRRRALWKGELGRGFARQIALSRDGKTLAVYNLNFDLVQGGEKTRISLHDFPSGKERGVIDLEWRRVAEVCFDARGRLIFGVGDEVRIWDTVRVREVGRLKAGSTVQALALSPDGKTAALQVGYDGEAEVKLLDLGTGRAVATGAKGRAPSHLAFTADGKSVLFADSVGAVVSLDAKTGKRSRVIVPADKVWRPIAAFTPDGRWLARSDGDTVRVNDMRTGKQPVAFEDHRDGSSVEPVPSPDGRLVATRSASELRIWELESGKMLRRIAGREFASGLRWSANGKQLTVGRRGKFAWYDAASGRLDREIALPEGAVVHARVLANGREVFARIVSQTKNEHIECLLTAADGKVVKRFQPVGMVQLSQLSEDGRRSLWWHYQDSIYTLRAEEATGRRVIWQLGCGESGSGSLLSPTGRLVAVDMGDRMETWDTVRRRLAGPPYRYPPQDDELPPHPDLLAMSKDERTVVLGQSLPPYRLHLVEVTSGRVRAELPAPDITDVAFTRDGRRLVTVSTDGTVLVWDVAALADRAAPADPWKDLASADARVAFAAVCALVKSPGRAVDLLASRLPVTPIDPRQVQRWIDNLDSDTYAHRSEAERRLSALGEQVEEDLRAALKEKLLLEKRLRLERLLKRIETGAPETLRRGRAVEVLERVGTGEAVRLLQRLAQGQAGSRTTREAREALARLRRGPGAS